MVSYNSEYPGVPEGGGGFYLALGYDISSSNQSNFSKVSQKLKHSENLSMLLFMFTRVTESDFQNKESRILLNHIVPGGSQFIML